jgi:hypothetical protein
VILAIFLLKVSYFFLKGSGIRFDESYKPVKTALLQDKKLLGLPTYICR